MRVSTGPLGPAEKPTDGSKTHSRDSYFIKKDYVGKQTLRNRNNTYLEQLILSQSPTFRFYQLNRPTQKPEEPNLVASTISHEFEHIAIYTQWHGVIGKTGTYGGYTHTDTDAIPDSVENDRTMGSIGFAYELDDSDPDTFDLDSLVAGYAPYGDNDLLAREAGHNSPRTVHSDKNWSKSGAQWKK